MKVKVIRKFRDLHTGEIHEVDDVLEVTEERFAEINTKKQFVRKTRARKKAKADEPEQATEAEALSPTGTAEADEADAPEGGE